MTDTQMIEQRLRDFMAVPDDPDWDDVLRRAGEKTPTRAAPLLTRRRMALALAACIAVAAPAVVFSGLFSSSHTPAPQGQVPSTARGGARPPGFTALTLRLTHGAQGITSIDVTVKAPGRGADMLLQVLRGNPYGPDFGRQVVFQGHPVPMTDIASPADGPPGTVALSTWSGTLSPSDWDGGCQNALYAVQAQVGGMTALSEWFSCSSG
jgi:hypothetical protein